MTNENSLMSGCGLRHKSAEDGCKSSWVMLWGSKL